MRFTTKQPRSQCVTFRGAQKTFELLQEEAEKSGKSISTVIGRKIRNSFSILFVAAKETKEDAKN